MSRYSLEDQKKLFDRIRAGDMDARDEVITAHFGLVRSMITKSLLSNGIEFDDLFQAGCLGLLTAATSFDPARGIQFATYATPYIRKEIMDAVRTESSNGTSTIPEGTYYLYVKIMRRVTDLTAEGTTDVAVKVAHEMKVPVHRVHEACAFMSMQPKNHVDADIEDCVGCPATESAEDAFFRNCPVADILDDIPVLTDFERNALRCRFRFAPYDDEAKDMTYDEIGRRLGVSTSCAFNTVERALSKIRATLMRATA